MSTFFSILLAIAITVALLWAYFTAQRLNRMHIRTDAARENLRASLDRRAAVITATIPELAEAARAAEQLGLSPLEINQRCEAEAELARRIAGLEHPPRALGEAEVRVELAQRFYNQAVTDTRALRTRPLVRGFRLAGNAPLPVFAELPLSSGAQLPPSNST